MKKTFKMAAFALCGMAMMSLTACLNGGDDKKLVINKSLIPNARLL